MFEGINIFALSEHDTEYTVTKIPHSPHKQAQVLYLLKLKRGCLCDSNKEPKHVAKKYIYINVIASSLITPGS